jgi:hypothetical protein
MKRLSINNIVIQFDCPNEDNNMEATQELLDSINDILLEQLPEINARVIVSDMFSPVDIDEI